MKCPNCGGHMGLEDAKCPYCGTPNTMALKHQSDMNHFRQEYQRTQADVIKKTSVLQRHGSWLIILVVMLVALVVGIILHVNAWDIGYSIRANNVERSFAEDKQVMDDYLAKGDYGQFLGYYDANSISLLRDNPYQGVWSAAYAYTNLVEYVSTIRNTDFSSRPEYLSSTCEYIADSLIRVYTLEERYSYDYETYFPDETSSYVDDIRERCGLIAKTYFGLTDEEVKDIPNMSSKKLGSLIKERVAQ